MSEHMLRELHHLSAERRRQWLDNDEPLHAGIRYSDQMTLQQRMAPVLQRLDWTKEMFCAFHAKKLRGEATYASLYLFSNVDETLYQYIIKHYEDLVEAFCEKPDDSGTTSDSDDDGTDSASMTEIDRSPPKKKTPLMLRRIQ